MINKATALETVLRKLEKLPVGHALDLRTYKRNRSILIKRISINEFDVVEKGFFEERFLTPFDKMKKLLKVLFKKEFPRSTKIRIYDLGPTETDIHIVRRKI
ncbi:MAG: hypothetical protein JEY79_07140 [Pseudodesulfovibrio sp.]|nr:hypothetical protein [Pseudodesulfovibrio sp.]